MPQYSRRVARQQLLLIIIIFSINIVASLKCRTEDGLSDAELKRVTRSCMRKIGENSRYKNIGSSSTNTGSYHNHYGQEYQNQKSSNSNNFNYEYDDDNDSDDNNNNYDNYNRNYQRNDDILQQRNRNRDRSRSQKSSSSSSSTSVNNERERFHFRRNNNGGNNNNNNNNNNGNHRSSGQSSSNNNHNGNGTNNGTYNSACVTHCFFAEMNMLNQDDYPDRQKVLYMLTKDLRDRSLRDFYTDTIQECFYYMESQRRQRDKCLYSRDLITCMTEYAKANCDDWQEYNLMFN